ncbi:hypothetical protein [Paraliobacillus sediminis]|uniref:hypothetical protein n=1 Tax=Paraliobacillus sediminis TaxID=1885916 RepID=UPI000E3E51D9|nr:hypothetical protein [Paraliobacillus sediminis]
MPHSDFTGFFIEEERKRKQEREANVKRQAEQRNTEGQEVETEQEEQEEEQEVTLDELKEQAKEKGIKGYANMKEETLIERLKG